MDIVLVGLITLSVLVVFGVFLFLIKRSPSEALVMQDGVVVGRKSYHQLLEDASRENLRLKQLIEQMEARHTKDLELMKADYSKKFNALLLQITELRDENQLQKYKIVRLQGKIIGEDEDL